MSIFSIGPHWQTIFLCVSNLRHCLYNSNFASASVSFINTKTIPQEQKRKKGIKIIRTGEKIWVKLRLIKKLLEITPRHVVPK